MPAQRGFTVLKYRPDEAATGRMTNVSYSETTPFTAPSTPLRKPAALLTIIALTLSLLGFIPLGFVIGVSIDTGWETARALLLRPRVGELLTNTVLLVVLTLPICTVLGVLLAWLTERTTLPARRLWSLLLTAPLAIPAFVQSYAWITTAPGLHGLPAGVFLSVVAYLPFVYLPCAATLRRLNPALEDVAATLGVPPVTVFFRVVLPQLKLAIGGGLLLIALHLLAEYGLFAMIRFDTFTTAIFDQFQSTFNGPAANMLAGVLALLCLFLLCADARVRGVTRYAHVGSGAPQAVTLVRLSLIPLLLALLLLATLVLLTLGVPFITLSRWLWFGGWEVWQRRELLDAFRQTMTLALSGAALTTLAAIPMAWLTIRHPSRLYRFLEGCNYITSSLPGIVVALALVTTTIHIVRPLYQTEFTVLLAYLLMFMPRALVNLRAGIAQAPVELEQVAASLGRSPLQTLMTVTVRLAAPGVATGATLVFLAIVNELTATLLLAPNGTRTLATGFWALTSEIDYPAAAPYALILVLLSLPWTWFLYTQSQKMAGL